MPSLTIRWFISGIRPNSPDAHAPSTPLARGAEKQASIDAEARQSPYTAEIPPGLRRASAAAPPAATTLSSATLGLFRMFWRFRLTDTRIRHIPREHVEEFPSLPPPIEALKGRSDFQPLLPGVAFS